MTRLASTVIIRLLRWVSRAAPANPPIPSIVCDDSRA